MFVRPKLIIADEPLSSIDVVSQTQVSMILKDLVAAGIGILLITHDLHFAMNFCNRIILMAGKKITEFNDINNSNYQKTIKLLSKGLR